jgi:murein DD-endopeptidase MepM/ murein hydrolase activator NlpD
MTFRHVLWVASAGLIPAASLPAPQPLRLIVPVTCAMQRDCLIQKLVDVDPTLKRVDYRCGSLTTNGHDGVDIRLRTMADMRAGVNVIAAGAGRVLRARDGEPDMDVHDRVTLDGRDAGNGAVIDHGNGWETQYSHLRKGTVAVSPGMKVSAGDRIGDIGMSGNAEFPHLHFTVRHKGQAIDPFTGQQPPSACRKDKDKDKQPLWTNEALQALRYRPSAVIAVGFSSAPPAASLVERDRQAAAGRITSLILWADVLGALPGDIQHFEIRGPDGLVAVEQTSLIDTGGLSWLAFAGRKAPKGGWAPGTYEGRYELTRSGAVVDVREGRLTIE